MPPNIFKRKTTQIKNIIRLHRQAAGHLTASQAQRILTASQAQQIAVGNYALHRVVQHLRHTEMSNGFNLQIFLRMWCRRACEGSKVFAFAREHE